MFNERIGNVIHRRIRAASRSSYIQQVLRCLREQPPDLIQIENRPFALWPLLQEVSALLQPMAEAKGLQFALACSPQAPEAPSGDPTRIRQILFNLGHNAFKFCRQGQVSIHLKKHHTPSLRVHLRQARALLVAGRYNHCITACQTLLARTDHEVGSFRA